MAGLTTFTSGTIMVPKMMTSNTQKDRKLP